MGRVVGFTGTILGPFAVTTYWYFAQAFLGAMKRVAGRTEDGEEQGKRGIVRINHVPTKGPAANFHNGPTTNGNRCLGTNNSTRVGIPRPPLLRVDPHPTLRWQQSEYRRSSLVRSRMSGNSTGPPPLSSRPGIPGPSADFILITVTAQRTTLSAHR